MPRDVPPPESVPSQEELAARYKDDPRVPEVMRGYLHKRLMLPFPIDLRIIRTKGAAAPGGGTWTGEGVEISHASPHSRDGAGGRGGGASGGRGDLYFATGGPTQRLRILSGGNVYMGDSVNKDGLVNSRGFIFETSGTQQIVTTSTSGKNVMEFGNPNGNVGRITTSGSSTTYYNSSDYRLKENATTISDGITRLKTLIPRRFSWKVDSTNTLVDGFFAHEVTAVPEAISGVKDEVYTEDNPVKGISKGDPLYQMIDQSKLVPLLTAALQEAITKIETLETQVRALQSS